MNTVNTEYINSFRSEKDFLSADGKFISRINAIAEKIADESDKKPIVLLSGPSGSGKTTTACILESLLDGMGRETHVVSLDDYFLSVLPEEKNAVDYESPSRIDGTLLTEHIRSLIDLEEISVPKFDFKNMKRDGISRKIARKMGEIVIFEGIHALNPNVISPNGENTVGVYVSVRTRVSDGFEVFHPKYVRLLRRMSRDKLFRGRDLAETLSYFESVEDGEIKHIMPFKYRAEYNVDTFIPYELTFYKNLLSADLKKTGSDNETLLTLNRLLKTVEPRDTELCPISSPIREFIG